MEKNLVARSLITAVVLVGLLAVSAPATATAGSSVADTRPCGRIIFSSVVKHANIFKSVKPDGTGLRRVAWRNHGVSRISPDGATIAYTTFEPGSGGGHDIWLIGTDGRNARELISLPQIAEDIAWAPDSRSIAMTLEGGDPYLSVAVIDVTTGEVTFTTQGREPDFSPDGTSLVFSATSGVGEAVSTDIFVVDLASGDTRSITNDPASDDSTPKWSPDGAWIAFNRSPHDQSYEDVNAPFSDLWRVTLAGTDEIQLTSIQNDGYGASPASWSPKGGLIAYNTVASYDDQVSEYLRIVTADGDDRTKHFFGATGQKGLQVSWAPNGRQVAFERWRRGSELWKFNLVRRSAKRLTRADKYDSNPQWVSCRG